MWKNCEVINDFTERVTDWSVSGKADLNGLIKRIFRFFKIFNLKHGQISYLNQKYILLKNSIEWNIY